jgi:hypothetical protein
MMPLNERSVDNHPVWFERMDHRRPVPVRIDDCAFDEVSKDVSWQHATAHESVEIIRVSPSGT